MEGVRGLSVTLVFFVHYIGLAGPWLREGTTTSRVGAVLWGAGHQGVSLFFVLSGFLIYGALVRKAQPYLKFMRRRVQRLYPTFLAVFALYLALSYLIPSHSRIPAQPAAAAGYLLANVLMLPGIFAIEPIITVAWSLSYEMFFYLTVPLIIAWLGMRGVSRRARAVIGLGIAAVILVASFQAWPVGKLYFLFFIAGALLFEACGAVTEGAGWARSTILRDVGIAVVTVAGLAAVGLVVIQRAGATVIMSAVFFTLCFATFQGEGLLNRIFSWAPLRWLGNMSYSYYLVHGLTLNGFFLLATFAHAPDHRHSLLLWAIMPLAFGVTLIVSAGLFLLVERPLSLETAVRRPHAIAPEPAAAP